MGEEDQNSSVIELAVIFHFIFLQYSGIDLSCSLKPGCGHRYGQIALEEASSFGL